jgi:flagellar protein FlaG
MITNATSKVDLPVAATRTTQTDGPQKSERAIEPAQSSDFTSESQPPRAALGQAVSKVREFLQQSGSRLQIEVDQDLNRVIVKILNGDSGEVIRQIPPQEVIDLAKNLSGTKGLLLGEYV